MLVFIDVMRESTDERQINKMLNKEIVNTTFEARQT